MRARLFGAVLLFAAATAGGQAFKLTSLATGLSQPVAITNAGDERCSSRSKVAG